MSVYKLKIQLTVLDELGVNLYSNTPAMLSELVANSWDADAENVQINFDLNNSIKNNIFIYNIFTVFFNFIFIS